VQAEEPAEPVVQPAPVQALAQPATEAEPAAARAVARPTTSAPAQGAESSQPSPNDGATGIDGQVGEDPLADLAPLPAVAPADQLPLRDTVTETADTVGLVGLILSILAIVGLGILAIFALRRGRKVAVPVVERPKVAASSPAIARSTTPIGKEAPAKPERDIRDWAQPVPAAVQTSVTSSQGKGEGLANAGASVALPRQQPATFEERDALLRRMVAAKPDRANPFRSPRARAHRARLIMQSLGRTFENGTSRIDLSQYPLNWPELANRNYPAVA